MVDSREGNGVSGELDKAYVQLDNVVQNGGLFRVYSSTSGIKYVDVRDRQYQALAWAQGTHVEEALSAVGRLLSGDNPEPGYHYQSEDVQESSALDSAAFGKRLDVYCGGDGTVVARLYASEHVQFGRAMTSREAIELALKAPIERFITPHV